MSHGTTMPWCIQMLPWDIISTPMAQIVPWHIMTHGVIIVFHGTQVGRRGTSVLVAQSMPRYNIVLWHNVYRGAFFVPWVKYGVL